MKKPALAFLVLLALAAAPAVNHLRLTAAEGESEFPSIVFTGAELGIAWMDGRDGNQEVYFRTADALAGRKGPETRLTNSETWDDNPQLAWTGSEFALSWIHESKTYFDLMFQRLDPAGKPRGPARALLRQAMLDKNTVLRWTGAGFGVVASEFKGGPAQADLYFRYLDEGGNRQGQAVPIAIEPGIKAPAAMLKNGSDFAIVYLNSTAGAVNFLRTNPLGSPIASALQLNLPGTRCGLPAAANSDKIIVVAWPQDAATGNQVVAVALSPGGEIVTIPTPVTVPGPNRPAVAVAAGKEGFGLAWIEITEQGRMLFFQQLDPGGKPLGTPLRLCKPRPVKVMGNSLAMTADAGGYIIAWVDVVPPMNSEVILSRVGF